MLLTAKKWAKKHGKGIDDVLMGILYDPETPKRDVLAAIKLFKDYTMARMVEGGETDRTAGPAIYLPEQHPALPPARKDSVD